MNDMTTWNVSGLGSFPDFLAFTVALAASFIVSLGAQKSSLVNKIVTFVNLAVILFIMPAASISTHLLRVIYSSSL